MTAMVTAHAMPNYPRPKWRAGRSLAHVLGDHDRAELVIFGVTMFGDAIRNVLDPRLRGSGAGSRETGP